MSTPLIPALDELAAQVDEDAGDDPTTRLRAATDLGRELSRIGDALVEQFVVEARAAGLSWTQIGELVGMKGRAAERRYAAVSVLAGAWPGELADRFAGP